jgi:hypothetical protein
MADDSIRARSMNAILATAILTTVPWGAVISFGDLAQFKLQIK